MPQPQVRVTGSGFTVLYYDAKPIAWLSGFRDSGQAPVESPKAIYELGLERPKEIVTGYTLSPGTITATITEVWSLNVWEHLAGLRNTHNILDVYEVLRERSERVTCQMVIRPPNNAPVRGKIYHGCVVTAIPDAETIAISGLDVSKDISIAYTHTTRLQSDPAPV